MAVSLISPTTELEAVNECLENIGNAPVASIAGELGVDTQIALNFVRKVSRELQTIGWHWNTEIDYELTPSGGGDIFLPTNILSVDTYGDDADKDYVQRGLQLYDRENKTYTFTESVKVTMILGFGFEDLPETARRYITMRAARLFQDRIEGTSDSGDREDEARAMATLQADQLRNEDNNILTGSNSMFKTLNRIGY